MDNTKYKWVIVAAGGILGCIAIGAMFSLPVFLLPISRDTGWSRTAISSAMTIGFIAMAMGGMGWGAVSDRYGPRVTVLSGSILLVVALTLASMTKSLILFQLFFGLLVGSAASGIFAPMMATVTGWFDTNRSLAVSLVSAGMGVAPVVMSPLAAWLVTNHDWRTSMQILAVIVAVTMIPLSFLVRRPPALAAAGVTMVSPGDAPDQAKMTVGDALRSPQFIVLALTNFFCCATHSGPIFHTVSYAIACGIPLATAVTIYSVEGIAGMGGRIVFGLAGDRFGAKPVLAYGLLFQAFCALAYAFVSHLPGFYTVAVLFGFTYAGVMPLYSVLARENFPLRMMGTIIGGTAMAGSLGMATGPLAGGLIYDTFATYVWLYVGASGMGLGAFIMALNFKPMLKTPAQPLAA